MNLTSNYDIILRLVEFAKQFVIPVMLVGFLAGLFFRALVYFTISREDTFAIEFEKRANKFLNSRPIQASFSLFVLTKKLLEKTFYEIFEIRGIMKRRKLDYILEPSDRIFLIMQGSAYLVKDTLKEVKYLKYDGNKPPLMEIAKAIFQTNPCFSRVFGIVPIATLNEFLTILPGLFIITGILGTFLGIITALPELAAMDIKDPEATRQIMTVFLAKIAYSMSASTLGIILSVTMTIYNNFLSPEKLFVDAVNRFERILFRLWSCCDNNRLPEQIPNFDENRDPIEALAEIAVDKYLTNKGANGNKPSGSEESTPNYSGNPKDPRRGGGGGNDLKAS